MQGDDILKEEGISVHFRVEDDNVYDSTVYIDKSVYGHVIMSYDYEDVEAVVNDDGIRQFLDWLDPQYFRQWATAQG